MATQLKLKVESHPNDKDGEFPWHLSHEPRCEKTGFGDFRTGPTKTRLYSHRRWLEA